MTISGVAGVRQFLFQKNTIVGVYLDMKIGDVEK